MLRAEAERMGWGFSAMMDMLDLIAEAKLGGGNVLGPSAESRGGVLSPQDLESGPRGPEKNCLLRLRHTHHMLARAIAEGKSNEAAAAISGYAPSTVSALKGDPAFQELVTHYRGQVEDLFSQVQDRLGALGLSFLDELQHRLEHSPESFSIPQLQRLAESLLDRSIAPSKGAVLKGGGGGAPAAISVTIDFSGPKVAARPAGPILDLASEG